MIDLQHLTPAQSRLACFFVLASALAVVLSACVPEKKEIKPDKELSYESFTNTSLLFGGIPGLEFPYSGLPSNYAQDTNRLHKILSEELGIGHVVAPMQVRKAIGKSQYQQMMLSAARSGMPHWNLLDQVSRFFPHHRFMVFMQPTPVGKFRNHLVINESDGQALQTISEVRGGIRFTIVNMGGLKKLSMDATLRKSKLNIRVLPATTHQGVRVALRQPVLKIKQEWYPEYPSDEDLYRSVIEEFIILLRQEKK